ncbi:28S ribosomal protein S10, mitochondrial-like [Eriocheir sinensis]|uniref:28S ribosomal protein S10, mitochondrial-like n=1 Tax=Eriocheir sinensis TaxID=95602 RepID=UPI0021C7680F|nr:28S ribosomal protein S10, mitochondrial-like [Eriocheir sinensis]
MLRPASRLLLLGARPAVDAGVPGGASWVRVTPLAATATHSRGVASSSSALAGLFLPAGLRHPYTTPALLRPIHTSPTPASDASTLVEVEADHLYSCVEVECRSHEPAVLRSYLKFVSTAAGHLDVPLEEIEWPKKHIKRWTLLKSVHIHKKHRVQYEARTHFLIMRFRRLTGSTADTFLEYIQRNLPEGVAMKVTMHELEKLPQHVKPSPEVVA